MSVNFIKTFDDSDEEVYYESTNIDDELIRLNVQERTNPIIHEFNTFLKDPSFINPIGDPTTKFINLDNGKPYNIPDVKINKYFRYLEALRRKKLNGIMWSERQYFHENDYSGIMIDLDVYQDTPQNQFTPIVYNLLFRHIATVLKQFIKIEEHADNNMIKIHIAILKKDKILKKSETGPYKDGIHILIPGVRLNKPTKKIFIQKFKNKNADVFKMIKINEDSYKNQNQEEGSHKIVDTMSSVVPVFFFGCVRDKIRHPYVIEKFVELTLPVIDNNIMDPMINDLTNQYGFFDEDDINLKT